MADGYDVVVVGGGHNGLVAAAYLGRSGRRVLVLERRPIVGGAAVTEEIYDGFRGPTVAAAVGQLRPEIQRDLNLAGRGVRFLPMDPALVTLGENRGVLRFWADREKTVREIETHSAKDAQAFPRFWDFMLQLAHVAEPLMIRTPPNLPALGRSDQLYLLRRAWKLRRLGKAEMYQALRFPPMCLTDFLREWFETELLRASLAADGLFGTFRGPWSPGTAFGLLRLFLGFANGGWNLVRGGTGALSEALAGAARDAGVTIRTDAPVARILAEDGRVAGVQLASGETIPARAVASTADPKETFLKLVDAKLLDSDFLGKVRSIQTEGCTAKINLALGSLPDLKVGGPAPPHVRIAPTVEYIERAYDDAKYGKPSEDPVVDAIIPTLVDPTLAPPGKHVMSVVTQYAPHRLSRGSWEKERDRFADRVVDLLDDAMPGLKKAILGRQILTPVDLEERFGLTDGHPYHGEMTLNQQFVLRPVPGWSRYRTPIEGLYLGGSGAHPGGGITGAPGYNAAREILKDWAQLASST